MRLIDAQFLETPWYGSRQMARHLRRQGYVVGRKRIRRLMAKMGLAAVYQRPQHHGAAPGAPEVALLAARPGDRPPGPGLVRRHHLHPDAPGLSLSRRDHGLGEPARAGLEAVNTMDADFCIEALEEAMARHGRPEIFNTDQGSQFTSPRFTDVLIALA